MRPAQNFPNRSKNFESDSGNDEARPTKGADGKM